MMDQLIQAWFNVLNNNVIVGGTTYPVYRTNVDVNRRGHYVLLRKESGSFTPNKSMFDRRHVIILEVVTKFPSIIADGLVDRIYDKCMELVFNSPSSNNLNVSGLVQIDPGTPHYIDEDDGTQKIYRKLIRFTHLTAEQAA